MASRDARSIETLRNQLNGIAPNRSKRTDGTRASPDHTRQNPKSDHEPNAAGVVTAFDVTHDPAGGMDARVLAETLRQQRDSRIKYVISDARIFSSTTAAWQWRPYNGANAHRTHTHISVSSDPALYDDPRAWAIGGATVAPPTASSALRQAMGQQIVNFEAQRDAQGRIKVYNPPANDGGGAFEVAGINVRWHAAKAEQLKRLIEDGHHEEAEAVARDYVLNYTAPISGIVTDAGLEFYLRDSYFNRGPGGAMRILQRALRVEDDGVVGPITRAALAQRQPAELLTALRHAREDYERNVVGFRENFWRGLTNRWDKALDAARNFQKQQESPVAEQKPSSPTAPVNIPQSLPQSPDVLGVGVDPKKMQDILQVAMVAMMVIQMMQGKQVQLPGGLIPQGGPVPGGATEQPPSGGSTTTPTTPPPSPGTSGTDQWAKILGFLGLIGSAVGVGTGTAPLTGTEAGPIAPVVAGTSLFALAGGILGIFNPTLGGLVKGIGGAFSGARQAFQPPAK